MTQSIEIIRGVRFNGQQLTKTKTINEEEAVALDVVVEPSTSLEEHALGLDVSQVKAVFFGADQAGSLRINSNTADPLTLSAETPILWADGDAEDNPLGVSDVTKIFITNDSTTGQLIVNFRGLLSSPL